jgi:hypothetical protein
MIYTLTALMAPATKASGKRSGGSIAQSEAKRVCRNKLKRKLQLKLSRELQRETNVKYCLPKDLLSLLLDTGVCSYDEPCDESAPTPSEKKQIKLSAALQDLVGMEKFCMADKLLTLLLNFQVCKHADTFDVLVQLLGGKEVKITLDEECRSMGDLKAEVERLAGVPIGEQELYWFEENPDKPKDGRAPRVPEGQVFDDACTLALCVNEQKPSRPRFMVVLFAEFRRVLTPEKYAELKDMAHKLRQSESTDKARQLLLQIRAVVGPEIMKQAIARATTELKARKAQLKRYEALLIHIVEGGVAEKATDTVACRNLSDLLKHYQKHGGEKNAHLDQKVNAMRTIIDNADDPRVLILKIPV